MDLLGFKQMLLIKLSSSRKVKLLVQLNILLIPLHLQKAFSEKRKANNFPGNGYPNQRPFLVGKEGYRPIDMKSIVEDNNNNPLMKAIASGEDERASTLIAKDFEEIRNNRGDYHRGRDINTANRDGITPLHLAAEKSNPKIISALLTTPEKNLSSPVNHHELDYAKTFQIPKEQRDARGLTPIQILLLKDNKDDQKTVDEAVDLMMSLGVKLIPNEATNEDLSIVGRYLKKAAEASKLSEGTSPESDERMSRITVSIIKTLANIKTLAEFPGRPASSRRNIKSATLAEEISHILNSNPVAQKRSARWSNATIISSKRCTR